MSDDKQEEVNAVTPPHLNDEEDPQPQTAPAPAERAEGGVSITIQDDDDHDDNRKSAESGKKSPLKSASFQKTQSKLLTDMDSDVLLVPPKVFGSLLDRTDSQGNANLLSAFHEEIDADLLHRAVADAGRWAFGIMAAEVWIYNEESRPPRLFRPPGGGWIDPVFLISQNTDSLERLVDVDHPSYVAPRPQAPGEGLGGILWAESEHTKSGLSVSRRDVASEKKIVWRDVRMLANDPDRPTNERIHLLADAGFGWAAGVPFDIRGIKGIVVYMSRSWVDPKKLHDDENVDYLESSTDLIGAAYALREPRRACIIKRRKDAKAALKRAKIKVFAYIRARALAHKTGAPMDDTLIGIPAKGEEPPQKVDEYKPPNKCLTTLNDITSGAIQETQTWLWKFRGGNAQIEQRKPFLFALFTFVAAFTTMLTLSLINDAFIDNTASRHLIMGPLGSLMTIAFVQQAAPAAQPRNILIGQFVSILIAIVLRLIPGFLVEFRTPLAVALAACSMALMGTTHAPGSSLAVVFSSSDSVPDGQIWNLVASVAIADIVVIIMATMLNNMNSKRQYPIYWGYIPTYIQKKIKQRQMKEDKDTDEDEDAKEKAL